MPTTTAPSESPAPSRPADAPTRAARRARTGGEDLYDFRRYHYADGWDDDDAALGWVDEEIVRATPRRRVH